MRLVPGFVGAGTYSNEVQLFLDLSFAHVSAVCKVLILLRTLKLMMSSVLEIRKRLQPV